MLPHISAKYMEYGRFYHNLEHINYMKLNNWNNDVAINHAIDYHDAVYDASGNNEERSADLFLKDFRTYDHFAAISDKEEWVYEAILATKDHKMGSDDNINHMILLDLKGLQDVFATVKNWYLIREEAKVIMNVPHKVFYLKNIQFMSGLMETMEDNKRYIRREYASVDRIIEGIKTTINMSLKAYDEGDF